MGAHVQLTQEEEVTAKRVLASAIETMGTDVDETTLVNLIHGELQSWSDAKCRAAVKQLRSDHSFR